MGVAAIVLAAGASRRMGRNKLLIPGADGVPMLGHVVRACLASRASEVLVVVGHEADAVRQAVPGARCLVAPLHALGMAESLKAGIAATSADAALICLGDMPHITPAILDALIAGWQPGVIVVPVYGGRRGNPVLLDRCFFAEMAVLSGDVGARQMLQAHSGSVTEVPVSSNAIFIDFDTPEAVLF